jgi:diadenosine tetraphosphatase ApaH/serine/threonine PP2A family protein phosphatase|tara:strand:+ start:111 stop:938 length:828 start_codon:yes stop_codon:yes gene_type:complete
MKRAIISDVHANLPALEAALEDIATQGADEIIFLGDAVGYGPNWLEVTQMLAEHAPKAVMGNHDCAVINFPFGFNEVAAVVAEWTKQEINQSEEGERTLQYLNKLPDALEEGEILYVHASPIDSMMVYIDKDTDDDTLKKNFDDIERLAFVGHSHKPLFWEEEEGIPTHCLSPSTEDLKPEHKYMINVGSVGQPREGGDSRACYVILHDANKVEYRKVEYNVQRHIDALNNSTINEWLQGQEKWVEKVHESETKDPFISKLDFAGYLAHRIEMGK